MRALTAPIPFAGCLDAAFTTDAELVRDDKHFYACWLWDLVTHPFEWRHPRCVAPNALSGELCTVARDGRQRAEHVGWIIESGELGYRVVGYDPPDRVYTVKPGSAARSEAEVQVPGQLSLVAEV